MKWISVKERLPGNDDFVLVWANLGEAGDSALLSFYDKEFGWNIFPEVKVTHWMTLPEPPKE